MKTQITNFALCLGWLTAAQMACAQPTIALSNLSTDTPPDDLSVMDSQWVGKQFTTGGGQVWDLDSIQLTVAEQNFSTPFTLSLYSDASGAPGISLVTFDGNAPENGNTFTATTFSAPANTTLSPDTTYWLVASIAPDSSATYSLGSQLGADTSYSGLAGWSFATGCAVSGNHADSWTIYSSERNPMYELDLTPPPVPEPTVLGLIALGSGLLFFRRRK